MELETIDDPVEAGLERWLTPMQAAQALGFLGLGSQQFSQIVRRLKHGLVKSVAEHVSYRRGDESTQMDWLVIPASFWRDDFANERQTFWRTGDLEIHLGSGYDIRADHVVAMFGVRFHPEDIAKMGSASIKPLVAVASQPSAPVRRQDLPLLPEPIARAWMEWFKGQPGASKASAEQSAANMFPNHNLSRDRIRDLFGHTAMGRPLKTDR